MAIKNLLNEIDWQYKEACKINLYPTDYITCSTNFYAAFFFNSLSSTRFSYLHYTTYKLPKPMKQAENTISHHIYYFKYICIILNISIIIYTYKKQWLILQVKGQKKSYSLIPHSTMIYTHQTFIHSRKSYMIAKKMVDGKILYTITEMNTWFTILQFYILVVQFLWGGQ